MSTRRTCATGIKWEERQPAAELVGFPDLEARGVMPIVWRVAFRSPSAESAIVNAKLNVNDKHIASVLLCEDLDSSLREAFKASTHS